MKEIYRDQSGELGVNIEGLSGIWKCILGIWDLTEIES